MKLLVGLFPTRFRLRHDRLLALIRRPCLQSFREETRSGVGWFRRAFQSMSLSQNRCTVLRNHVANATNRKREGRARSGPRALGVIVCFEGVAGPPGAPAGPGPLMT